MNKDIQPKYYEKARVTCACGNSFTIGSTQEYINVEVCSKCHPFYTGKEKVMDTMGRVDKFKKRLEKKVKVQVSKKDKKEAKAKKKAEKKTEK